eukprot:TRINITY_DN24611_c0_g1_i1.p1 TRINITY_DN24611_c0_g1~~TRINITY_DN24611_c0_g1_i1.p1  ORF type:complete len:343 (+),score=27.27 TRINITY_DN24611_c0_g1_i1:41-1069(+)
MARGKRSHSMRPGLKRNLANPQKGCWGCIVTQAFKWKNRPLEVDTVASLSLKPRDCVLEVGFGPGIGLKEVLKQVSEGHVYGIELSDRMVATAESRLAKELKTGRLELIHQSVDNMSDFTDEMFDKVFHCNCMYFWSPLEPALRELYRVMAPGALMVAAVYPHLAGDGDDVFVNSEDDYIAGLQRVGFEGIKVMPQRNGKWLQIHCYKRQYGSPSKSRKGSSKGRRRGTSDGSASSSSSSPSSSSGPASSSDASRGASSSATGAGGTSGAASSSAWTGGTSDKSSSAGDSGDNSSSSRNSNSDSESTNSTVQPKLYPIKGKDKKSKKLKKQLSSKALQHTLD